MKKRTYLILLVMLMLVTVAFTVAHACEVSERSTTCKAHYHQNIPIIGSRWPCIEGSHSATSDTSGHSYKVTVKTYQNSTFVAQNTGNGSTSLTTAVASTTGTAKAECTGYCMQGDGTLIKRTPQDSVW